MKGIVFSELNDMVDEVFGPDMMDDVLDECDLDSGGAYTSVGTYDHGEMLKLVTVLSEKSGIPVPDLVFKYGQYLFSQFGEFKPEFFKGVTNAFDFLESVDGHIHVEVRKLYHDAELPEFITERTDKNTLVMTYRSKRPFADLAAGMIQGCIDHFKENITVDAVDNNEGDFYGRIFTMTKHES